MIFIENFSDLFLLVDNDEPFKFLIEPKKIINDIFICKSEKTDKQTYAFFYKNTLEDKKIIELTIYNNIIIEKNFYLIENGKNICYRENEKPTEIIYNYDGSISYESWKKGLFYFRSNYLTPTSISYKENVMIFVYTNSENKKISISDIIYDKNKKTIISCSMKIFNKKLDLFDVIKEFPNILETNEEDCFDLSKRILTKDILDLKELEYY